MKNYYEILGFKEIVKPSIISNRHLDLTKIFITNRQNGELSTHDFEEQTEAFYLLYHPKRKVLYDQLYAIKFKNKTTKSSRKTEKLELKIETEITAAQEAAKELAQLTNEELRQRNKAIGKRSWLTTVRNIAALVLDFLSIFS